MGKIGTMLNLAGLVLKPFKLLRKGKRALRRTGGLASLGAGIGIGKNLSGRDMQDYDSDFNKKYSNFVKYSKFNGVPREYYDNFKSISDNSSDLDYAERIKTSLDILDRMREEKAIGKREYRNLKDRLYDDFKGELVNSSRIKSIEDYLPLAASFLFLFSGSLFFNARTTGFSVLSNVAGYKLDFFGVISFMLSLSLLLVFLKRAEKK